MSKFTELNCNYENTLLSDEYVEKNIENVKKAINSATTTATVPINNEILQKAMEMFTFLNYCPPKQIRRADLRT